jgi:peptidoglycan/xylan/chitin deacetylase (PgdA/CDA1 family)
MLLSHVPVWWGTLKPDSRVFSPVLRRLPTDARRVWLTIDDGPSDDTLAILDLLDRHGMRATFFVIGERAARRPELIREIVRRGHTLGNHSQTHPQAWFWALGPRRLREEIARNQSTLAGITGTAPRWFRAVVGLANPFVAAPLREHGLARVAWCARGFDAVASDPHAVVARIERAGARGIPARPQPGSDDPAAAAPGGTGLRHRAAGRPRTGGGRTRAVVQSPLSLGPIRYFVATTRQLLNGVLPYSGVNSTCSPAAAKRVRRSSASG